MKKRLASLIATAALAGGALAAVVAPIPASAAVGPGEDRQITSPAPSWYVYTGLTAAQVTDKINSTGARLTDVKVTSPGASPKFTIAMVGNSGAFATSWYWFYNMTPSEVATYGVNNSVRPTSLSCYLVSGATKCSVIFIANTGANAEGWAVWNGSYAFVQSKVTTSNRLVSLSRVQGASTFTGVFGSNTGTDNVGWTYYHDVAISTILTQASDGGYRLVDIDRNSDTGRYNAIGYKNPSGTPWYVYTSSSLSGLVATAQQKGQRIFDLQPYVSGSTTYYAALMVNQLSSTGLKMNGILASKVPNGSYGFQFSQVGGSTLGALQSTKTFEPASALKVLYHYKTILLEQQHTAADGDGVAYRYDPSAPDNGGICPDNFNTIGATNLKNADTLMMQNSDNRMTRGIVDKFGKASMLSQATSLGMTSVAINHNIGCPTATTHNAVTLSDLNKLYTAYANKKDITSVTWRTQFHDRMVNESNYSGYRANICPVVKTEAAAIGKSTATATAFCNAIVWLAKGGSYQYGGDDVASPISYAEGDLTTLPFKTNGTLAPKSYFYGDFFDQVHFSTASAKSALGTARTKAYTEAIRPYIRSALATW